MGLNFAITDNSGAFIDAKNESVIRALEGVGLFLEGECADELENDPRRVDTGRLKGSITHAPVTGPQVTVGTNVEYGIYVHEGTSRMKANPFLKNGFERNMDQVEKHIVDELKKG